MRPWLVWVLFAICLAVVLAAMGWASATVWRLDATETAGRQQAALEENVRLALWRMDSALAPIIARESTWPYFAYASFYPAQRAYTNMLTPVQEGEILVPSPLLNRPSQHVLLHFQIGPDREFTSPQVPTGNIRSLAEQGFTTPEAIDTARELSSALERALKPDFLAGCLRPPDAPKLPAIVVPPQRQAPSVLTQQRGKGEAAAQHYDLAQRQQRQLQQFEIQQVTPSVSRTVGGDEFSNRALNMLSNAGVYAQQAMPFQPLLSDVREGLTRPVWLDGRLLLARRVFVNGREYIQGSWLDWPAIEQSLLESIRDLLPEARLEPVSDPASFENGERVLAALPVRLIPGALPPTADAGASPLRMSLAVAWACMLVAAGAVALLLAGALSLSERRGAFVSAVTHEMRTPLTTFRMYTEMLVKDMVPAERRTRYLDTLRVEADRLAHLVENVLAYARLERGKPASRLEPTTPAAILDHSRGRLADRAEQSGMRLVVEDLDGDDVNNAQIHADPMSVEQILFNLVDNACKYAAEAMDKTIHFRVRFLRDAVAFEVADHGAGIPPDQQRRLFRPFSKSAQQAAHSAPGVGLGLALSRRLARRMGGDLCYEPADGDGARFVLTLPWRGKT